MTTWRISLPWPPRELSPNARGHWSKMARAKKKYRAACGWAALAAGAKRIKASALRVHVIFVPPVRRHRDEDNLIAAMKAGFDGVADVVRIDDSRWRLTHELAAPEWPGRVDVVLEPLEERPGARP